MLLHTLDLEGETFFCSQMVLHAHTLRRVDHYLHIYRNRQNSRTALRQEIEKKNGEENKRNIIVKIARIFLLCVLLYI